MASSIAPTPIRSARPRQGKPVQWGHMLVHLLLIVLGIACLLPMLLIISISLSDELIMAREGYSLLPQGFSTFAYEYILREPGQILRAYFVTGMVTAIGTIGGLILCSL